MFAMCLFLLLDALFRLQHPHPNRIPGASRVLTCFNSQIQLWVVFFLPAVLCAPGLRFSCQVHPFLGVNEQALAQELHTTLVLDLSGNLG